MGKVKEKRDSESLNSTDVILAMTSGKPRGKKKHSGEVTLFQLPPGVQS